MVFPTLNSSAETKVYVAADFRRNLRGSVGGNDCHYCNGDRETDFCDRHFEARFRTPHFGYPKGTARRPPRGYSEGSRGSHIEMPGTSLNPTSIAVIYITGLGGRFVSIQ